MKQTAVHPPYFEENLSQILAELAVMRAQDLRPLGLDCEPGCS